MAVTSGTISVTTAAKKLELTTGSASNKRKVMVIHNPTGGAALWLGGSGVTSSNGFPLAAGSTEKFCEGQLPADRDWYAIAASGTIVVQITESD